ncbi:thiamine ABC transporter substrate-binding protein [Candidatus Poseidonia alphae]|nr:thiamine ABC transporter substrate-binding protein [Candidatus Poseidonia alphae]
MDMKFCASAFMFLILVTPLSGCLEPVTNSKDGCSVLETSTSNSTTVRILTYDIAAFSQSMLDEFTNSTGYEIELIRADDAGGILEQLLQTQGTPQSDIAVGLDNTYLQTALDFCLLQPHSITAPALDPSATQPYDGTYALPFDQGDVCLNVDENGLNETERTFPEDLWELTEPEWNGKTSFPSPVTSSPGRAFMIATIDYFENDGNQSTNAFDWWEAMADNDARFTSGWTEAYEVHYSGGYGEWTEGHIGDSLLTVSYCHSPGVEAFYSGNSTHSTSITLERSTFHQVEYAGLTNGATNVNGANAFLNYLLSEDVNRNMPENNLMLSVLQEPTFPETDGYQWHTDTPTMNANVSMERIAQNMDTWLNQWQLVTQ